MTTPDQPCHLAGMHPADCPAYVAGMASLRARFAAGPAPEMPEVFDGTAWRPLPDVVSAADLNPLGPTQADVDAAYERGVAEGRRQATAFIANEIRVELVCCDIYEHAHGDEERVERAERSGHAICFWGEAAARIAEGREDSEAAEQVKVCSQVKGPHPAHDGCPGWGVEQAGGDR